MGLQQRRPTRARDLLRRLGAIWCACTVAAQVSGRSHASFPSGRSDTVTIGHTAGSVRALISPATSGAKFSATLREGGAVQSEAGALVRPAWVQQLPCKGDDCRFIGSRVFFRTLPRSVQLESSCIGLIQIRPIAPPPEPLSVRHR